MAFGFVSSDDQNETFTYNLVSSNFSSMLLYQQHTTIYGAMTVNDFV